jgi:glutamate--cysteine ligase
MKTVELLNERINERRDEIETWFAGQSDKVLVPLYTSVDLRVSDYKIAPVDTNVFPAGFNNLSQEFRDRASGLFKDYFVRKYPKASSVMIIPELHTRNPYYWENISVLKSIIENVGYEVDVGIVSDDHNLVDISFKALSGKEVIAHKVMNDGHRVVTSVSDPDLILINNDFSEKCPKTLRDIMQPVEPPVEIGWHTRKKSVHFEFYNKLVGEIAGILDIDPGIVSIKTVAEEGVNFDSPEDRGRAAVLVESILDELREEYRQNGIEDSPYVFLKSNSGTYGMAVMSVTDGDQVRTLNAEGRKRMRVSKGGKPVRDIVIQEGIPTSLKISSGASAEPVLYMVEAKAAGGFLRLNKGKSVLENLNSRGMEFSHMYSKQSQSNDQNQGAFLTPAYELLASVASIATGYEIEKILKEGGCKEEVS